MKQQIPVLLLAGLLASQAAAADIIYDTLQSTGDTRLFAFALGFANTTNLLAYASSAEGGTVTVFAPSDQALLGALGALGLSQGALGTAAGAARMLPILLYHAITPAASSADLISAGFKNWPCAFGNYAAYGQTLTVNASSSGIKVISYGTDANVVVANITAGSSIIHVIDSVLLPLYPSPSAAIVRNGGLSTLAGLVVTYAPGLLPLLGPKAELTVFAPRNSSFLTALSTSSTVLAQLTSSTPGMHHLLKYHITKTVIYNASSDTLPAAVLTLAGLELTLVRSGGNTVVVFAGGNATIVDSFSVGLTNSGSQRAAVHIIDQVLLPPTTNTIADALAANGRTSVLTRAFKTSSAYASLLNSTTFQGTILAPIDSAFTVFLVSKNWTSAALLASSSGLKQLLDLHTIPGAPISLSAIVNGTNTTLTTNSGPNTLWLSTAIDGTVVFSTASGSTAAALGYEYFAGYAGNTTIVIFVDTVLLPANLALTNGGNSGGGSGAAALAVPSPFALLLSSLLAAAALHLFGRH